MTDSKIDSNTKPLEELYWAAYPDHRKAVSEVERKRDDFYTWVNTSGRRLLLQRMWIYYHLAAIVGPVIQKVGSKGQFNLFLINECRALIQQQRQIIVGSRPVWQPQATNSSSTAFKETRSARNILDYYMRLRCEADISAAVETASTDAEAYYEITWNAKKGKKIDPLKDPELHQEMAKIAGVTDEQYVNGDYPDLHEGDLEFHVYSGYDVARDSHAETIEASPWLTTRRTVNKFDLAAKYPEKQTKILAQSFDRANDPIQQYRLYFMRQFTSDDVLLCTFWHRKTPAVPNGRKIVYIGGSDIVLEDTSLGYDDIPLERLSAGEWSGTSLGYTNAFELCQPQQELCDIYTALATSTRAHGVANVLVPPGTRISEANFTDGLNMWEGTGKPELINLLELSPEMFQFIDRIVQRMESILGLNGAIRGQAPSDSGAALAMSSTLATQANADFQAKYASFLERVGSRIIATLKQYATAPRMIEIAGPGDTTYLQEFSNKNLTTVVKTVADIGNPISKTPQGKYQLAQLILQTGQATPSMVFEVIQSGRLEPITDTTEDEQIRILVENEMMEQGDYNAIAVLQTDNDVAHSQQHNAVIKRLVDKLGAAAAANDPRYKAAMGHLMQHVANFEDPNLAPIKQMLSLPTAQQQQQEAQQNPGKGGGPNQAQPGQAQPGGPQPKPAGQPGAPKGANAGPPALPGSGQQAPKNATGGGIVSGE